MGCYSYCIRLLYRIFVCQLFWRGGRWDCGRGVHQLWGGLWHLLGEVEVVFGFWALVLMGAMLVAEGRNASLAYLDTRNFTEPLFVFAIMVIAATRPCRSRPHIAI